jgi:hypothetical protein
LLVELERREKGVHQWFVSYFYISAFRLQPIACFRSLREGIAPPNCLAKFLGSFSGLLLALFVHTVCPLAFTRTVRREDTCKPVMVVLV